MNSRQALHSEPTTKKQIHMSTSATQAQDHESDCGFRFRSCTGANGQLWWCVDCSTRICERCWTVVPGHRQGATTRDGQPHEKVDFYRHDRLREILNPPVTEEELEQLHEADVETTWFGIGKNKAGDPYLFDGGIYNSLITQCPVQDGPKHPQLVSFIGQTNAGKSTLIKMLIDYAENELNLPNHTPCASPVVGSSIHRRTPTSADVHLYADPRTYLSSIPVFYADAEGLDAGEQTPIGASSRRRRRRPNIRGGARRSLAWADTPERRERQFIVSELYPRLLYTFSDVVVFVLRNEKTFEKTGLERLIRWGAASLETSVNQPTLPQLVIVVNAATLNGTTEQDWEVDYATERILDSAQSSLETRAYFRDLAQSWRFNNRSISSIDDLIRCYYSSVKVVRVPVEGRYGLLDKQIGALRDTIASCCVGSFDAKRGANMLSNSEEFSMFLHSAFDHFTSDLRTPFNFIEVSVRNNPIPQNFGGHILQLAIALHKQDPDRDPRRIFKALSNFVASSALLDCVRHRKGLPLDHMADYESYFDFALIQYCKLHSPCTFENGKGRCVNSRSAHLSKGHQNERGRVIAAGNYQSDFTFDKYWEIWANDVYREIRGCQTGLEELRNQEDRDISDESRAIRLHKQVTSRFYRVAGRPKSIRSHTVCLSCLMGFPQHSLPCGHILCTPCIKGFGQPINVSDFELEFCPLHIDDCQWDATCVVRFKPDLAGVRVLSLDGGGIRGIVELEVLRAIQRAIGDTIKIPIRAFFDLIVGTSSGGIIALALGRNWTIDKCIQEFQDLCSQAFAPRMFHRIPILQQLQTLNHGSIYKTRQFHEALQSALGRKILFGGQREDTTQYTPKVAVTSTNEKGRKPIVIANYNRSSENLGSKKHTKGQYEFARPDDPSSELSYWEAAAATAAAPPYFKSFYHRATNRLYFDGAFYNNNPVLIAHQERKLLWPDTAHNHPDIFLSIGTGSHAQGSKSGQDDLEYYSETSRQSSIPFSTWHKLLGVIHGRMDNILDAENSWKDFLDITLDLSPAKRDLHYTRINPKFDIKVPDLDAVDQLKALKDATRKAIRHEKSVIQSVARKLIASSFYFDLITPVKARKGIMGLNARVEYSVDLKAIYVNLETISFFSKALDSNHILTSTKTMTKILGNIPEIINNMRQRGAFDMNNFDIMLSSRTARVRIVLVLVPAGSLSAEPLPHSISGFPRTLGSEVSSGWISPRPASGTAPIGGESAKNTQDRRRKHRKVRMSTGGIAPPTSHEPRTGASRAFSMPIQSKTKPTDDPDLDFRAELQDIQPPTNGPTLSFVPKGENQPQELPSGSRFEMAGFNAHVSEQQSKTRSADNGGTNKARPIELPAGNPYPSKGPKAGDRGSFQPSSSQPMDSSSRRVTLSTSAREKSYPDGAARLRNDLRSARRMRSERDLNVAPNRSRAVELSAPAHERRSSRQPRELSKSERVVDKDKVKQRRVWNGHASEEDVSLTGSQLTNCE